VSVFAVVTGGGTAGHVLPALAVAEALVAGGREPSDIHYMGARRGIETKLLEDTPFAHSFFDVVGLQREISRRNIGFVPKMVRARRAAIDEFAMLRPRVVVSVGGYASMPAVLAARHTRVPIVVVSYDRFPGRASKLTARWAAASAVAFPDSPLPRATLTGAPVRRAVLDVDRERDRGPARAALGLPDDRFVIAVMGGSQGSAVLNSATAAMVSARRDDTALAIRHAVGERFMADAPTSLDGGDGVIYQPVAYEDRMPLVYAAADVVVGRGGASTVHEVAVTGIPAILVPWAASAEDHQSANVGWLADQGGAITLPETQIARLDEAIDDLRNDPGARERMSQLARAAGEVHRRGVLAQLVESVAVS
jgi:UDP-N-acetylglucosamine:LPS N-acetylglucosamine transferase